MDMNYRGGNVGGRGVDRMEWSGGKWDNCNSIINKYIFLKKKHTSRPIRGAETGTGAERTRMAVVGPRLAMKGAGSLTTSRPCSPTFPQINREGRTQSGGERGRQSSG